MKCEIQRWHLNCNYEFPKHSVSFRQYLSKHLFITFIYFYILIFLLLIFFNCQRHSWSRRILNSSWHLCWVDTILYSYLGTRIHQTKQWSLFSEINCWSSSIFINYYSLLIRSFIFEASYEPCLIFSILHDTSI